MEIRNLIKKLFHRHKGEVVCWHWSHGYDGMQPINIEIQLKCTKCGKYFYRYIFDYDECLEFEANHKDKQWSDNCKPNIK